MQTPSRLFLASLCALALGGAGCSFFQSTPEPQAPGSVTTPTTPGTPTTPSEQPPVGGLPQVDDTWVTYTSKSLGFSLKTPTKGTLAPTWEVSFVKAGDSNLVDGCYQWRGQEVGSRKLKVGETEFCHTGGIDPGMSNQYWTDYYLANIKNVWVLVTFQKHTTTGDVYGDERCHGKYIVNGESCSGFKTPEEYYAHLDQIMGTFVLGE